MDVRLGTVLVPGTVATLTGFQTLSSQNTNVTGNRDRRSSPSSSLLAPSEETKWRLPQLVLENSRGHGLGQLELAMGN